MTAEASRKAQHLKSITIVSGSRENAARYIFAHLRSRDRILCPEQELSVYDSFGTQGYSAGEDAASLRSALDTALRILESPNFPRLFLRSVASCRIAREVSGQLQTDVAVHIVDADTFPPVIGITGSFGAGKTGLLNRLEERGFRIFRSEEIYQKLLHSNSAMIDKFYEVEPAMFDDEVCDWTRLNMESLRLILRRDPLLRDFLTNVIHAHVRQEIVAQLMALHTPAVIESPALFESKLAKICSVAVEVAVRREEARFRERCDYILTSDTDLDAFATNVLHF